MTAVQIGLGSSTGRGPYSITLPTGVNVGGQHVLTGDITGPDEWVAVRYTVCVAELARRGWPSGQCEGAALVAVTIWALEVGWGAAEWHFNIGNVHCTASSVRCTRVVNRAGATENLVAWSDILEGVSEWWNLIGRRYAGALPQFRVGDLLAWNTLRCGGYGGSSVTAADALSIHNRVRRIISEDWEQVVDAGAQRVRDGWTPAASLGGCGSRAQGSDTGYGSSGVTPAPGGARAGSGSSSGGGALLLLLAVVLAAASSNRKR